MFFKTNKDVTIDNTTGALHQYCGGSYSDKLIAWSNKVGSKTFDKVEDAVQYIIDKYIG